jgi:hypothetical protein
MSYMSSNPYVLNLVPLFNVADNAGGATTAASLATSLATFSNYFDFTTNTIYTDRIQPFTTGGTITVDGNLNVIGTLEVNGVPVGADSTTGTNTVVGSNVVLESGSGILDLMSSGSVLYYPTVSTTTNFYVSSSIFRADKAAIGTNGTSALSTIFDVWGGDAYFDRSVYVKSNVYCQNVFTVSDERWKSNTRGLGGGALSTLMELRGVRYDLGGNAQIGFLAQEVEQVLPEAVSKGVDGGPMMINYTTFIPLVVEAIKELARNQLQSN